MTAPHGSEQLSVVAFGLVVLFGRGRQRWWLFGAGVVGSIGLAGCVVFRLRNIQPKFLRSHCTKKATTTPAMTKASGGGQFIRTSDWQQVRHRQHQPVEVMTQGLEQPAVGGMGEEAGAQSAECPLDATLQPPEGAGSGVIVDAEFPVKVSAFQIPKPTYLGVGVRDEIQVKVVEVPPGLRVTPVLSGNASPRSSRKIRLCAE